MPKLNILNILILCSQYIIVISNDLHLISSCDISLKKS